MANAKRWAPSIAITVDESTGTPLFEQHLADMAQALSGALPIASGEHTLTFSAPGSGVIQAESAAADPGETDQ